MRKWKVGHKWWFWVSYLVLLIGLWGVIELENFFLSAIGYILWVIVAVSPIFVVEDLP
jgi:hypothetical protein